MSGRPGARVRWRRAVAVGAWLLGPALIAGCASLPSHSAVRAAHNAGGGGGTHNVTFLPPPPMPNADRGSIVAGYLQAMLGSPAAPQIVREYLTPAAARQWNPAEQLQVYESATVDPPTPAAIEVQLSMLGAIDDRGTWTSYDTHHNTLDLTFQLARVAGQWRVTNPISGTLVDIDYMRHLQQYSMYFFDPTHLLLTPDPVYLPVGHPETTANALVTDLLAGPTASMDGVVHAGVPRGTTLAAPMTISPTGLANISLTGQARSMTPIELKQFAAELVWTLRQPRLGISRIRLSILGRPVHLASLPIDFPVDALRAYGSPLNASRQLFGLVDQHLQTVSLTQNSTASAGRLSVAPDARSAAIQIAGKVGAVVTADGTKVWVGPLGPVATETPNVIWDRDGHDLLPPSWDVHNLLWLVDRTPQGAVVSVWADQGHSRVVHIPGVSGQNVRAFAVSRDGARLAAIVGAGASSRLEIAMIARTSGTAMASLLDVSVRGTRVVQNAQFPLIRMTQLAWYSPTSVVVLAQDQSSEAQPFQISIDGSKVQRSLGFLPVLPASIAAVGDPGDPAVPLVVGTADGLLYSRDAHQNWSPFDAPGKQLLAPTYPG